MEQYGAESRTHTWAGVNSSRRHRSKAQEHVRNDGRIVYSKMIRLKSPVGSLASILPKDLMLLFMRMPSLQILLRTLTFTAQRNWEFLYI